LLTPTAAVGAQSTPSDKNRTNLSTFTTPKVSNQCTNTEFDALMDQATGPCIATSLCLGNRSIGFDCKGTDMAVWLIDHLQWCLVDEYGIEFFLCAF